jgi:hypothetical protein
MRSQRLTRIYVSYARRRRPLPRVINHAAAGVALASLFVGVLCSVDATMARLLRDVDGLIILVTLFMLHAALFGCASFATAAGESAGHGGSGAVGSGELRLAPQPARRQRSAQAQRRPSRP